MKNCTKEHSSSCPILKKKLAYDEASKRNPFVDNPFRNWTCSKETTCHHYQEIPPRMTPEEFETQQDELLKEIPEEFRSAIFYKAWEDGHSSGYEEVIYHVKDLISTLEEPIAKFEQRIRRTNILKI